MLEPPCYADTERIILQRVRENPVELEILLLGRTQCMFTREQWVREACFAIIKSEDRPGVPLIKIQIREGVESGKDNLHLLTNSLKDVLYPA